ncbi:MAG: NAD(P)-dependent oxidoreductase [Verrucomicrobiota bacterium]|nr:MAG: NAD(P)-dependent oxidoreductase [Verrucomicrobiota bacterium]
MNILMTGAAGYIATHCAKRLRSAEHTLFGIDFFPISDLTLFEKTYRGDAGNQFLLKQIFQDHGIECILYASGSNDFPNWAQDPAKLYSNDLFGLLFLLAAAAEKNVKKFVYLSTTQVYAPSAHIRAREDLTPYPSTTFGKVKYAAESMISAFAEAHGLRYVILRLGDVLGANPMAPASALGHPLLSRLFQSKPIYDRPYAFVHVEDVVQAIMLALASLNHKEHSIYNITAPDVTPCPEFLEKVATVLHQSLAEVKKVPNNHAPTRIDTYRAQRELNWHLQYPDLDYMISSTSDWLQHHGKR